MRRADTAARQGKRMRDDPRPRYSPCLSRAALPPRYPPREIVDDPATELSGPRDAQEMQAAQDAQEMQAKGAVGRGDRRGGERSSWIIVLGKGVAHLVSSSRSGERHVPPSKRMRRRALPSGGAPTLPVARVLPRGARHTPEAVCLARLARRGSVFSAGNRLPAAAPSLASHQCLGQDAPEAAESPSASSS